LASLSSLFSSSVLELVLVREVGIILELEVERSLPSFAPLPLNAVNGDELDFDSSYGAVLPGAYVDV